MTLSEAAPPPTPSSPRSPADIRRGQTLELEIQDLAFGGRSLTRVDGYVIFVDNALPGDRVVATVFRKRRRYAEARADRVLAPATTRVPARCEHASICGGCRFQELEYAEQLRHKERQVAECLAHLGGVHVEPRPAIPAKEHFHYLNKMEYSFGRDSEGRVTLGLHRRGYFDRPFNLGRCHIATPISSEIVTFVREVARRDGLSSYDTRRHEGLLRFLVIRQGIRTGHVMVNLVVTEGHPAFERLAADLRRAFPSVTSVVLNITRRRAQIAIGEEELVLAGSATILETLGGLTFEISSNSFFQTSGGVSGL